MDNVDNTELTVATWNTIWASGSTSRAVRVRRRLRAVDADLLVVTEGQRDLLPDGGHVADAGSHWGYDTTSHPRRRKTVLWSRWPLTEMAALTTGAGAGRVLTAQTVTSVGAVRVVAVCIPWASAQVSTGRRDATTSPPPSRPRSPPRTPSPARSPSSSISARSRGTPSGKPHVVEPALREQKIRVRWGRAVRQHPTGSATSSCLPGGDRGRQRASWGCRPASRGSSTASAWRTDPNGRVAAFSWWSGSP
ncbi:endonuclease/exonuclease/phosphatase family protein [Rhodococcus aetherivorans]|uniref:endonuclease/exonuclease/phosphatase family protein n=1 Tax=Rhodococcus aetherivorans TaxID=191292 RepID=UPI0036716012